IPANATLVFDVELVDFLPESVIRQMQQQQMGGAMPGGMMPEGVMPGGVVPGAAAPAEPDAR
ncbi:MAG: FKBP-type peptidyl-prolyl cis-trans isomerase, partial [Sphingomonas bacterium]|nr:FKBP-type peptidyl-prolyl cis-trans isomerase [Sphingomonas bacterium]